MYKLEKRKKRKTNDSESLAQKTVQ